MIPIVFINCSRSPFVDEIISGKKQYETRSRNTLSQLFDRRILIAETGNGKPLVKCSARIVEIVECFTKQAYESFRYFHAVPVGSEFDWNPDTKKKVLYRLADVQPVPVPFHPAEGKRHGRVWMEYDGKNFEKTVDNQLYI